MAHDSLWRCVFVFVYDKYYPHVAILANNFMRFNFFLVTEEFILHTVVAEVLEGNDNSVTRSQLRISGHCGLLSHRTMSISLVISLGGSGCHLYSSAYV